MKLPTSGPRQFSFLFMRHGETLWNRDGLTMGQVNIDLSAVGCSQAQAAVQTLLEYPIDHIVCSPLVRCLSTIQPYREKRACDFEIDTSWAERAWGIYEGRPKSVRVNETSPEGGETCKQFSNRVSSAVANLHQTKTVLVVSHSGVFRQLCKMGYSTEGAFETLPHATPIVIRKVVGHAD